MSDPRVHCDDDRPVQILSRIDVDALDTSATLLGGEELAAASASTAASAEREPITDGLVAGVMAIVSDDNDDDDACTTGGSCWQRAFGSRRRFTRELQALFRL